MQLPEAYARLLYPKMAAVLTRAEEATEAQRARSAALREAAGAEQEKFHVELFPEMAHATLVADARAAERGTVAPGGEVEPPPQLPNVLNPTATTTRSDDAFTYPSMINRVKE